MTEPDTLPRIIIVGGGFGGLAAARGRAGGAHGLTGDGGASSRAKAIPMIIKNCGTTPITGDRFMILLWSIVWEASSADAVKVILGSRCSFPKLVLVIEKSR